jgi:hypothetical protein
MHRHVASLECPKFCRRSFNQLTPSCLKSIDYIFVIAVSLTAHTGNDVVRASLMRRNLGDVTDPRLIFAWAESFRLFRAIASDELNSFIVIVLRNLPNRLSLEFGYISSRHFNLVMLHHFSHSIHWLKYCLHYWGHFTPPPRSFSGRHPGRLPA